MKRRSLGINALLSGFQNLLNIVFPLITFPYVSRILSVSGMGKYNFSNSIISYFLLIAGLGINSYAVREGASLRKSRRELSEFASKVFTINLISTIFSYILLGIILFFFSDLHKYKIAILIFSIQILFTTLGVNWIYTIFEEYAYITVRNILFKIISMLLLFVFVKQSSDYLKYVWISVFASTGSYVLNFIYAKKFCDLKLNFNFDWDRFWKPILIIFASNIAVQIYVNSDTTILGFMKSNYIVGIYGVSVKIYSLVANLLWGTLLVTVPRLSMLLGNGETREYHYLLEKLINMVILIVLPTMVGLFMLSPEIVTIIASYKYIRAAYSLRILCFALIFKIFGTILNDCVLLPAKRENKLLLSYIIAATINIIFNFILIPTFSENGSAFTTLIAEFLAMIINLYYCRDLITNDLKSKKTINNFLTVLIACSSICLICLLGEKFISGLVFRLIIIIPCSILCYTVILFLLKNEFISYVFNLGTK
ncbi:flippase [Limosilactobacillus mucosae]|uniref:flippase n=1 Tax=Limosilactobacillus mucosae TaxID=97478 RepID=UPI00399695F0